MPKTYTVKEVADILGFSTNSIYTFLKEKRIKGVRVGKGRFRIPEDELARILHIRKKDPAPTQVAVVPIVPTPSVVSAREIIEGNEGKVATSKIALPNMFDWFVGMVALIAGVGLFLFNQSFYAQSSYQIDQFLQAQRIILMTIGIGMIVTSFYARLGIWQRIFKVLVIVSCGFGAMMMAQVGDVDGTVIYSALGLAAGIHAVATLSGVVGFGLFQAALVTFAVATLVLGLLGPNVQTMLAFLGVNAMQLAVCLAIVAVVLGGMYWKGYSGHKALFALANWLGAALWFVIGAWYADLGFWSRAFVFVVIGFFSVLMPFWPAITERESSARGRLSIHLFFVAMTGFFLLAIFAVNTLQQALWKQRNNEMRNKITLAQQVVNNSLDSVVNSVKTTGDNTDFAQAIESGDQARITQYTKILYESNPLIRGVILLDEVGDGVALYPYGVFAQQNYAFREYFVKARDTGNPFISNVFDAQVDSMSRPVVSVSVPVYTKQQEFIGVLSASLNLDELAVRLQQIASEQQGEYFSVVDDAYRYVVTRDVVKIGQPLSDDDPARNVALDGKVHTAVFDGALKIFAHDAIPRLKWTISIRMPMGAVVGLDHQAIMLFTSVIAMVLLLVSGVFSYFHIYLHSKGSGP